MGQYSLTYLRVEAFIWMGLVGLGLALIIARIVLRKTNRWLIGANSLALYVTLYACCFVNFGGIIAGYNVRHCSLTREAGFCQIDVAYLNGMGVEAIPAFTYIRDHRLAAFHDQCQLPGCNPYNYNTYQLRQLQVQLNSELQDWRQWTFRKQRLAQATLPEDVN